MKRAPGGRQVPAVLRSSPGAATVLLLAHRARCEGSQGRMPKALLLPRQPSSQWAQSSSCTAHKDAAARGNGAASPHQVLQGAAEA